MRYDQYHHIDADDVYTGTTPADVFEFRASAQRPDDWDDEQRGPWAPPPPNPELRDDWMPPPYRAVWADLPSVGERETRKLVEGVFEVVSDWRGHRYWLPDGSKHVISNTGEEPPAGALEVAPPPPLESVKAKRSAEIERDCAAQIIAGFACDALGQTHTYPSKPTDQANLTASVLDAVLAGDAPGWTTPFWCADAAGVWAWRQHTAAQIKAVGAAGKAAVLTAQARNATLQAQITAATAAAEVEAVKW